MRPPVSPHQDDHTEVLTTAHRRAVLRVEELDGRIVPSNTPLASPLSTTVNTVSVPQHALAGTGTGTYATGSDLPDVGTAYRLQGSGTFAGLGPVTITGSVHTPGFIANGQAGGTLKFSRGHASVTVQLTGLTQPGSSSTSLWFHYQVTGGTKGFRHVTDQGTLRLDFSAAPPVLGHGLFSQHGTFTLRI
jgi:hypothetical protein